MAYKTNIRETLVRSNVITTATGSNQTADIDIGPGAWQIAIYVVSQVTGGTTTVALHGLVGPDGDEMTLGYRMAEPDDSGGVAALAITGGGNAAVQTGNIIPSNSIPSGSPVVVPEGGLRIKVVNGTAVNGEQLEISLIATRWG